MFFLFFLFVFFYGEDELGLRFRRAVSQPQSLGLATKVKACKGAGQEEA
jgi:hypothetical protein